MAATKRKAASSTRKVKKTARTATRKTASTKARKTTTSRAKKTKTTAKKTVTRKAPKVTKSFTKSELFTTIAESADLTKKQVSTVFECLEPVIAAHIGGRSAPGEFTIPGLCKIVVVRKPATKARKGINPFTGEPTVFKAKPARNVVKIRALKKLKEMAA